jgi:hypothetical protein
MPRETSGEFSLWYEDNSAKVGIPDKYHSLLHWIIIFRYHAACHLHADKGTAVLKLKGQGYDNALRGQVVAHYREQSYEGQSVHRSQMDIKRKTCDTRTWKKHLFLDISSTNIATLVPSLYQFVETRSMEVFRLLSQPLQHLVGQHLRLSNVFERIPRPNYEAALRDRYVTP